MSIYLDSTSRLKELEGLIELAEASTTNLDKVEQQVQRLRGRTLGGLLIAYAVAGISIAVLFYSTGQASSSLERYFVLGIGVSGLGLAAGFVSGLVSNFRQRNSLQRELWVERSIHEHLVSLIDEQLGRVVSSATVSPIARATIEIRIKRIERDWPNKKPNRRRSRDT